ncbi:amidase [Kitasatospora indigofera]|uniref:amidase n=1 Tax=Kitasatospora indigofera TaxID=67307 RepID=UPI0036375504
MPSSRGAVRAGRPGPAPAAGPAVRPADPGPPALLALPLARRTGAAAAREFGAAGMSEAANAWAADADRRYRASTELRELRGAEGAAVRVGVKDIVDAAGFATRLGLRDYRHHPRASARVLRGLRGVVVNAKLVTPELSIGLEHGCVNPYFPHLAPSGSSTGSAVAVAANICDIALGTDSVASIRLPAAACGVVGLRMTHRPRLLDRVFPLSPPLDSPGWLARTAEDLEHFWLTSGIAGTLAGAPGGAGRPVGRVFRIGLVEEALRDPCAPQVRQAVDRLCGALADAGHRVVPVRPDAVTRWRGATYELCSRTAWDAYRARREEFAPRLADSTRVALEAGAAVGDRRYGELLDALRGSRAVVPGLFAEAAVDVWLMPVTPALPRAVSRPSGSASTMPDPGDPDYELRVGWSPVASWAGLPAITLPVAVDAVHRAPIAVQAVGPAGSEPALIALAREITRLVGGPLPALAEAAEASAASEASEASEHPDAPERPASPQTPAVPEEGALP